MTQSNVLVTRCLVLLLTLLFSSNVCAELATEAEMDQVCRNWLAQSTLQRGEWGKSTAPEIIAVDEIASDDGVILARNYSISSGGFVLVPALKEMRPIKAYSEEYSLDEAQEGGFLLMITELLQTRFDLYKQAFGSLSAKQQGTSRIFAESQRELWDTYTLDTDKFLMIQSVDKSRFEESGPLLTSSWHQGEPYNNLCPMGDGGRTVVGCVATATAQILNYWKWPPSGTGTHSYTWGGDNSCDGSTPSEELFADFSDAYDWDHIIDSCDIGCLPDDSTALAELCYEVGVAFEMGYGACGSGASTSYAATVFPLYYRYSVDATRHNRTNYDLVGYYNLIKNEVDSGRVGQYRINLHSIVVDGYRSDDTQYEYHMNYGWGNSFTAWYVLDSLYCSWVDGDVCPADEEFVITHIYPQDKPILTSVQRTITETSGDGDNICEPGESIDISLVVENRGWEALNASAELLTSDSYVTITGSQITFDALIPSGGQSTASSSFSLDVDPSCPNPHYAELVINYAADGGYSSLDTFFVFVGSISGFSDDMESGEGYWLHSKVLPTFDDQWHIETYRAHSGTTSWKVGGEGDGNYSDDLDAGLITPPVLLDEGSVLTFWHWIDAETGDPGQAWDGSILMIGTGDGNWTQITPEGGYTHSIINNPANPFDGETPCFSGTHDWEQVTVDLSAYAGVVQILFRFGTDGAVNQEGWYIDDVYIGAAFVCGDSNHDGTLNIGDAVYLINHIFNSGPGPDPLAAGDSNGDGTLNVGDVVYVINFIFNSGPDPICQ